METLFDDISSGALFSEDRLYRYRLWRTWDTTKPLAMFIGLNPSTANEAQSDPTIRCVIRFCQQWGYGGFYMMNLFALVSSVPEKLLTCENPVGENDNHLSEVSKMCADVIFAWGDFKQLKGLTQQRISLVTWMFPHAKCIWQNDKGIPVHPLWAGVYAPNFIKNLFTEPKKYIK